MIHKRDDGSYDERDIQPIKQKIFMIFQEHDLTNGQACDVMDSLKYQLQNTLPLGKRINE